MLASHLTQCITAPLVNILRLCVKPINDVEAFKFIRRADGYQRHRKSLLETLCPVEPPLGCRHNAHGPGTSTSRLIGISKSAEILRVAPSRWRQAPGSIRLL